MSSLIFWSLEKYSQTSPGPLLQLETQKLHDQPIGKEVLGNAILSLGNRLNKFVARLEPIIIIIIIIISTKQGSPLLSTNQPLFATKETGVIVLHPRNLTACP